MPWLCFLTERSIRNEKYSEVRTCVSILRCPLFAKNTFIQVENKMPVSSWKRNDSIKPLTLKVRYAILTVTKVKS